MAAPSFRVVSVTQANNVRGQAMYRVRAVAVAGDDFTAPDDVPNPAQPEGEIVLLVNEDAVKRKYAIGATLALETR